MIFETLPEPESAREKLPLQEGSVYEPHSCTSFLAGADSTITTRTSPLPSDGAGLRAVGHAVLPLGGARCGSSRGAGASLHG